MTDNRSSSALFKRAEQLKRWEESDTNKQSTSPKRASRIRFSSGIVFLAACTSGDKEEVQRLLKMGADINTANVDGLTALHQACIDDNLDMVEFLVAHGADVNRGDNEGWTPLHATSSCGFISIAKYLLENGADVAAVNYDGELPVDIAESDAMGDLLHRVIDEKGIDCEKSRSAEVDTLMNDARNWAANGYVEVRDMKTGGTPLHVAAAKGYNDVAKTLLDDCNAEPDCVDYEGWTPLHAAALFGQKEAAALLLSYGADPHLKNYSGQTCLDLVDPSISMWLSEAISKNAPRRLNNNNNNNKRKCSPPKHDVKRVDIEITPHSANYKIVNDKPASTSEIIKMGDAKPPKGRAPSPTTSEVEPPTDEPPSWRRSASFRSRQPDSPRDIQPANNSVDNDTILRRTHSFENDKTFYQRYRDVTARIKASSCPSIPPVPQSTLAAIELRKKKSNTNEDSQTSASEKPQREANTWTATPNSTAASPTNTTSQTTVRSSTDSESNSSNSTPSTATPTRLSPGNIFKNFFKSFVPPVRDEESETQRKAHAKRVRETRRSTQGVTLDEIKSAEQLVKKKTGNGTTDSSSSDTKKPDDVHSPLTNDNGAARSVKSGAVAVTLALACATATATATIGAASERRPSWRLRLDPTNKFELEDAGRASPRGAGATAEGGASAGAEASVTLPLRRPPAGSTANTTSAKEDIRAGEDDKEREDSTESKTLNAQRRRHWLLTKRHSIGVDLDDTVNDRGKGGEGNADTDTSQFELEDAGRASPRAAGATAEGGASAGAEASVTLPLRRPPAGSTANTTSAKEDIRAGEDEKERKGSTESKTSSNSSAASTQAALNVIQRRRRPKRRSTGVGHVDMDDIVNDRVGGGEGDADTDTPQSGSERTEEGQESLYEYKARYEASQNEVRRLRMLLATSESQLQEARASITRLTQMNQNSLSEIEKREKRAMERKLSEMEEELKLQQVLQTENQRLKDENGALIRVISKLSK